MLNNKINMVLEIMAIELTKRAKLLSPVGQYDDGRVGGRLRGSISWATNKKSSGLQKTGKPAATKKDAIGKPLKPLTVRIGTAVEYAPAIEFGTSKTAAQSFLRAAAKAAKTILPQAVRIARVSS